MLNNNQSGNTNHSLVILHATLNVCGKSAADFARQRTTDRSFFLFFFVVFWYFFAFLISASVCVRRPPLKTSATQFRWRQQQQQIQLQQQEQRKETRTTTTTASN